MFRPVDPLRLPGTQESPDEVLARTLPLSGTQGEDYVKRRSIPLTIAEAAGVRYAEDLAGRPAVIVALRDHNETLASVHGRYLSVVRRQDKMLTIGPGGGTI